tara:strand:+ start:132 stop:509 length:378 start_codon:yes stop_codon:yes gene_type:complete
LKAKDIKVRPSEENIQISIVDYLKLQYPNVLFTATMGGQFQRHYSQRLKAKRTGYLKGVSDLLIFEPKGRYCGLFIELKRDKKCYPTAEQKQFISKASDRGYYATCAKGFEQCKDLIDKYLNEEL